MSNQRIPTGVPGMDGIVGGGLPASATYLIKGQPGTGKTTLGLQFLAEGARRGERCLYLCLAETSGQLAEIAKAYGLTTDGIDIYEMRRRRSPEDGDRVGYTVFNPAEVELEETTRELFEQLDRIRPVRLVLDSLSEIRLVAEDPLRYRREMIALCDRIVRADCTAMLIDVDPAGTQGTVAETLVSGVICLEHLSPAYGGARRRLELRKLRASRSVGGYHDFAITDRGIEVYPRLVAALHRTAHSSAAVSSGLAALDALLGGGLDAGTSTVLTGPAGTGKSSLAALFVAAVAGRGQRGAIFCFDESPSNLLIRADGLRIPLAEPVKAGTVQLLAIDPAEYSPGELSHRIQAHVEDGARVIVLDSINGYVNSLPEERFLAAHLHELLAFLSEKGVATILTLAQHGLYFSRDSSVDVSYVADTVVLLRYFEAAGAVKQAISVVKKRTGVHERTIRELRFSSDGITISEPLTRFRGLLSGYVAAPSEAQPGGRDGWQR